MASIVLLSLCVCVCLCVPVCVAPNGEEDALKFFESHVFFLHKCAGGLCSKNHRHLIIGDCLTIGLLLIINLRRCHVQSWD